MYFRSKRLFPAILTSVLLTACGPNVHSPSIRGIGYVNVDEVVKHHPLYPQLSQLNDAIAAINLSAAAPHVPLTAAQIASETKELNKEMVDAQNRANKILGQQQQDYLRREQQAIGAALVAAGVPGAGEYASRQMSVTSAQQAQAAAQAASQDFMAYQQSVVSQDNAAAAAVARQLQAQAEEKYRAKAMELQQRETDLSLRLSQQDASQRLAIRTRLSNLALDEATRKDLTNQLAAIDAKENNAVAAQREADAATLSAFRNQLNAQTGDAIRSQVGAIQSQSRTQLEERRNEVGAQISNLGPPRLPPNIPPNVQAKIAEIHKQFQTMFQADGSKTIQEYNATKADLDRQFAGLHGADVGAIGAAAKELDALQKRRDDLYKQIVDQITREAQRIAKDRGLSVALDGVQAGSPGGYDMTNELTKDVESLHE